MSRGRTLLLFLDERPVPTWLRLLDGKVAERGEGTLPPAAADEDEAVVAVVPATDVALHWVELPPLAPAQALAAARLIAAEVSAEAVERLHVALGASAEEGALRPMAVVSAERMAAWLGRATALGLDPDHVLPESLLIEAPAEGVRRLSRGAVDIVRGPMLAFAAEPELAALAADGASAEPFDEGKFEVGLAAALAERPLDLRQGAFARKRHWQVDWKLVRRLAWLGAAIAVVTLLIQLALILRYSVAADRLERQVEIVARRALPRAAAITNPTAQLAERLAELRGGGLGFAPAAAASFAAVRDTPGVDLASLSYGADGSLQLGLLANGAADVAAVQQRLTAQGLVVTGGETRPGGGRQMADLTVRAP